VRANAYLRAVDRLEKEGVTQAAGDMAGRLIEALRALPLEAAPAAAQGEAFVGALPELPADAVAVPHRNAQAAARYAQDYPDLPASPRRLLAAALWRKARACYLAASKIKKAAAGSADALRQAELFGAGLRHVQESLALWEADPDAHRYTGILLFKTARDTKELIQQSYKIRDHTRAALQLRPLDPVLHHILGAWCFDVAAMGWVTRKLASAVFGSPPTSSYEEAVRYLLECERLQGGAGAAPMMRNRLKLAQSYLALGDKAAARQWGVQCMAVRIEAGEDEQDVRDRDDLAKKLGL
jgi:hypothetical protein